MLNLELIKAMSEISLQQPKPCEQGGNGNGNGNGNGHHELDATVAMVESSFETQESYNLGILRVSVAPLELPMQIDFHRGVPNGVKIAEQFHVKDGTDKQDWYIGRPSYFYIPEITESTEPNAWALGIRPVPNWAFSVESIAEMSPRATIGFLFTTENDELRLAEVPVGILQDLEDDTPEHLSCYIERFLDLADRLGWVSDADNMRYIIGGKCLYFAKVGRYGSSRDGRTERFKSDGIVALCVVNAINLELPLPTIGTRLTNINISHRERVLETLSGGQYLYVPQYDERRSFANHRRQSTVLRNGWSDAVNRKLRPGRIFRVVSDANGHDKVQSLPSLRFNTAGTSQEEVERLWTDESFEHRLEDVEYLFDDGHILGIVGDTSEACLVSRIDVQSISLTKVGKAYARELFNNVADQLLDSGLDDSPDNIRHCISQLFANRAFCDVVDVDTRRCLKRSFDARLRFMSQSSMSHEIEGNECVAGLGTIFIGILYRDMPVGLRDSMGIPKYLIYILGGVYASLIARYGKDGAMKAIQQYRDFILRNPQWLVNALASLIGVSPELGTSVVTKKLRTLDQGCLNDVAVNLLKEVNKSVEGFTRRLDRQIKAFQTMSISQISASDLPLLQNMITADRDPRFVGARLVRVKPSGFWGRIVEKYGKIKSAIGSIMNSRVARKAVICTVLGAVGGIFSALLQGSSRIVR